MGKPSRVLYVGAGLLVATTVVVTVLFKQNVLNFEALRAEASTCRSLIPDIAFLVACLIASASSLNT